MGDLRIDLIAPDGTPAKVYRGSISEADANCGGPYLISDAGVTSLHQASIGLNTNSLIPAGTYRASDVKTLVSLNALFGGKAPNGTWTLRFRDMSFGETGTVSDARLNVTTTPSSGVAVITLQPGGSMLLSLSQATPEVAYTRGVR